MAAFVERIGRPNLFSRINLSIRNKLLLILLPAVFLVLVIMVTTFSNTYRQSLLTSSRRIMQQEVETLAEQINRDNQEVASVVKAMASAQENGTFGDREYVLRYTRDLLERFPNFLGTYINYEPNADGNDQAYRDNTDCCTGGRFLPYWYWNDVLAKDQILIAPTLDLEGSEWYDGVKQRWQRLSRSNPDNEDYLLVTEPFVYEGVPMVSMTYPVVIEDEFKGIAGVDRSLSQIFETISRFKPYQTAEIFLLSRQGKFITASRTPETLAEQSLQEFPAYEAIFGDRIAGQTGGIVEAISPATGTEAFYIFAPVETSQWMVVMEVQQAEILAPVNRVTQQMVGISILLFIMLALGVTVLANRSILAPVRHIVGVFEQIREGNYQVRAELASQDEFGTMAGSLNETLDQTVSLIRSQEERNAFQAAIQKLVEEVAGVAEGDLTIETEVSSLETAAIADSINLMITQLRQIIGNVQQATQMVSASASEIRQTAEYLSRGSETQANQILDTSTAVEQMSVSIQQVSENALLSATVAQQALTNAQQGARAVQDTIQGMQRIRDQVQATAKRIKRLGESSQEIGEIVQVIRDIAKRTSILALNASLEAAAAGEAGRGFAVVAEDVKRLAERATNATRRITELISATQTETNAAVAAMEESTREVVSGSHLADQAGQTLAEIEAVSQRLAELIQSISQTSRQQAHGSEAIARSIGEIAEVTQRTAAGTKQAAVSINRLAGLADELRHSVSAFKLPNGNGHQSIRKD